MSQSKTVTAHGETAIHPTEPRVSLEELFQARSPAEWRAEYADAYDWGPDVGREVVRQ